MSNLIGNRVKSARNALGLTQAEFATLVGISQPYLGQIEAGDKVPSATVLQRMAKVANTSVAWLLDSVGDPASGYAADQRLAVISDPLAAPGLRALAEDEPMCHVLEITNAEWGTLRSVKLSLQPDKEGYLLLLQAVRHIERLANFKGAGRPRKGK